MTISFNGITKQITVSDLAQFSTVNVKDDIYSGWKNWAVAGDNAKYELALRPVGGDPTEGTQSVPPYFFLMNNWKIVINGIQNLKFDTNLYCDANTNTTINPFILTNASVINKVSDAPVNIITIEAGFSEEILHDGLDSYENKDDWKGSGTGGDVTVTTTEIIERIDLVLEENTFEINELVDSLEINTTTEKTDLKINDDTLFLPLDVEAIHLEECENIQD